MAIINDLLNLIIYIIHEIILCVRVRVRAAKHFDCKIPLIVLVINAFLVIFPIARPFWQDNRTTYILTDIV